MMSEGQLPRTEFDGQRHQKTHNHSQSNNLNIESLENRRGGELLWKHSYIVCNRPLNSVPEKKKP